MAATLAAEISRCKASKERDKAGNGSGVVKAWRGNVGGWA